MEAIVVPWINMQNLLMLLSWFGAQLIICISFFGPKSLPGYNNKYDAFSGDY